MFSHWKETPGVIDKDVILFTYVDAEGLSVVGVVTHDSEMFQLRHSNSSC